MSDDAHRRHERRRKAQAKTARTLRDQAQRAGRSITQTQALDRVAQAERKRGPDER